MAHFYARRSISCNPAARLSLLTRVWGDATAIVEKIRRMGELVGRDIGFRRAAGAEGDELTATGLSGQI